MEMFFEGSNLIICDEIFMQFNDNSVISLELL